MAPPTRPTDLPKPSCTTAVPGKHGYVPPGACNANWAYSPSFPAALAFSVFFGILTVAHVGLAVVHRKPFCWVLLMGVTWELVAFVTRALGALDQQSLGYAYPASLLFILAPLWINAFVYMTAGRLIWTYHPERRVLGVKAISMGKYFVWLDVVAFLVQGTGGSMLSPGGDPKTVNTGKNVYMSGVGLQQLFILVFVALIVRFHVEVLQYERQGVVAPNRRWKWLTYALYAVLVLITIRIIFRLLEFSAGDTPSNPLPYKEVYALVLDAAPMTVACLILAVVHPGLALRGPESEFPSRKVRRAEKKARKAEKKALKEEERAAKKKKGITPYSISEPIRPSSEGLIADVEMHRIRGENTRI